MRKFVLIFCLMSMMVLASCTTEQTYRSLQSRNQFECQKMIEPDRSKCLEAANKEYDEYRRDREKNK